VPLLFVLWYLLTAFLINDADGVWWLSSACYTSKLTFPFVCAMACRLSKTTLGVVITFEDTKTICVGWLLQVQAHRCSTLDQQTLLHTWALLSEPCLSLCPWQCILWSLLLGDHFLAVNRKDYTWFCHHSFVCFRCKHSDVTKHWYCWTRS